VGYADVYGGTAGSVALVGKGNIDLYVPKGVRDCPTANIVYRGPLRPPVDQGVQVAELQVFCGDQLIQTTPLFAAETVEAGDLTRRATDALKQLAFGWL
jgi:D-alanyl-D-alanine carboxypeptidase (penicillin-binding protein 5/6)